MVLAIMRITVLPPELVFRVAINLQPEDVANLAQTSKQFASIIGFNGLCKRVLMVSARGYPSMSHTPRRVTDHWPVLI